MRGGAKEYADALFSLSEELGTTEEVKSDLSDVSGALTNNPKYIDLCDTPAIAIAEKLSLIGEALAKVNESVKSLVMILAERHSVRLLPDIAKEYRSIYNESRNILEAEAVSAEPLTAAQIASIKDKLEKKTGKTVTVANTVDKSILSGVILRYMGIQLDGSLRARLSQIEKSLKNTIL